VFVVRFRGVARVDGGVLDGVNQVEEADSIGRRRDGVRVGGVDAVEADDGVVVHDAAGLKLRDFAVGEAYAFGVDTACFGGTFQRPLETDAGTAPQFPGGEVPRDLCRVVVAVQTQWSAEGAFVGGMDAVTAQVDTVRAQVLVTPGSAGYGSTGLGSPSSVDGTEAGSGEGGEHGGMPRHGGWDAFYRRRGRT
jgi:hypothetical protein